MAKALVIVESPAKAKTINKFLGPEYEVEASMGHVMDLPKRKMGVDIKHDFEPQYVVIYKNKKNVAKLKDEAEGKDRIFLACDPDREGEAICWHLSKILNIEEKKISRIILHEITNEAVKDAFKHPRNIDMNLVYAQQARRILDRIVGYNLSPLLWEKIGDGLSAGRVQSVAVRLICKRELAISSFQPQEYWEIEAKLQKIKDGYLVAKLEKIEGKKPEVRSAAESDIIVSELKKQEYIVSDIKIRLQKRNPSPPFTTSKLQQEAHNRLGFSARKTMIIAQQLYEGIELGEKGSIGLITYMRTDSVKVSDTALKEVRRYIESKFGKEFLPQQPNNYKSKKGAQEAHEAIRPTSSFRGPENISEFLSKDQYKLYELIWRKFIASQMPPAKIQRTSVEITAGKYLFRVNSYKTLFEGFLVIYNHEDEKPQQAFPALSKGEKLNLIELIPSQHFTEPPPRYTEASLIKELEEKGIGRPSTYAPTIYTILLRDYVRKQGSALYPTELGKIVTALLIQYFPKILDIKFTAGMEAELDEIEEGKKIWVNVLKPFYTTFDRHLARARKKMKNLKKWSTPSPYNCDKCKKPMVIKFGPHGKFLACSGFPKCQNAKSIPSGVKCPIEGCGGDLVERHSRRGIIFYGCSNFPKCRYTVRSLPKEEEKDGEIHREVPKLS